MNELMMYREMKRIMKYGIPKPMAKEIVNDVATIVGSESNGESFKNALDYAIDLTYRLGISAK